MDEHPIQALMTTAMENLKEMIDVNTIIGEPVETPDGGVILTVSKVGFGFATGGSEFKGGNSSGGQSGGNSSDDESDQSSGGAKFPFGGGSGGGVSITPIAFLVVNKSGVNILHLEQNTHLYEKLLDLAPSAIDKIQQLASKSGQQKKQSENNTNLDFDI